MRIQTTGPFDRDFQLLPETIKGQTEKQLRLLLEDPHHPSLRMKKIKGHPKIWEGRITKSYRFTFQISGETYLLRRIGTHNSLKTP
jgi:mRNA-degrading endonuclease YafQ of YafQ-DinJ toxin-antitoxin module